MSNDRKLYRVEIELELYVLAENQREAEKIAERSFKEEESASCFAYEAAKSSHDLPEEWDNALPYENSYGNRNDKTCKEIFEAERLVTASLKEDPV